MCLEKRTVEAKLQINMSLFLVAFTYLCNRSICVPHHDVLNLLLSFDDPLLAKANANLLC